MKTLFAKLLSLLVAAFSGVSYTEAEEKPFDTMGYYQIEQGDVNYKNIYDCIQGSEETVSDTTSNFALRKASKDKTVLMTFSSMAWVIALDNAEADFQSLIGAGDTSTVKGSTLIPAKDGDEVLSPANLTYIRSGRENEYEGKGRGLYIVLGKEKAGVTYEVTLCGLKRLWCDMDKTQPDSYLNDDTTKPQYFPSSQISTNISFSSGDVIGEMGSTGREGQLQVEVKKKYVNDEGEKIIESIPLTQFYQEFNANP